MEETLIPGSQEVMEPQRRERTRSPSPDICSICLSAFNDRCYSDGCFHMFCFICLLEWSKVKLECPLCKKPFKLIYHNIKDYQTYDVHKVEPPAPPPQYSQTVPRFNLPLAQFANISWHTASEFRRMHAVQRLFSEYRRGQRSRINNTLPNSTLRSSTSANFRRYIYANELYCEGAYAPGGETRVRAISPRFFSEEPARCHRLVPWLNRELLAILPHQDNIHQVIEIILEEVKHVDIRSTRFRTTMEPFTLRYTEHFIHEFRMFAVCPFDMSGFDRYARYARSTPRQSALDQYDRPLLLTSTSTAQSDTRADLGQTRSRRSRWDHPSTSVAVNTTSTSTHPSVHRFALTNLPGTSSTIQLSISTVMNNSDETESSTSHGSSNSSRTGATPTLSPSSSDSDIQVVSPPHSSNTSNLPTTSNHTSVNPPAFSSYSTPFGNSATNKAPSSYGNGNKLLTAGNRPSTPIVISDSDSSDSSISIADSLMQRKGSAAMNTRRVRLSSSSSCSSPEKLTTKGSILNRCHEPQLSEEESSSEQPSTSGLSRKRVRRESDFSVSSYSDCTIVNQSSNKINQPATSSSSNHKSIRKQHKHKKSRKSHKHSREDNSKHSSTESDSSPRKHFKRHASSQKIKTESKQHKIPGIETFSQSSVVDDFNGHSSNSNRLSSAGWTNDIQRADEVPTSDTNRLNGHTGRNDVYGTSSSLKQEVKTDQLLPHTSIVNDGENSQNKTHNLNVESNDELSRLNKNEDIIKKIRLYTKKVIAPKYKDN